MIITYVAETCSRHLKSLQYLNLCSGGLYFLYNVFCKHSGEPHLTKVPSKCSLFVLSHFLYLTSPFINCFCLHIFPHSLLMFYLNRKIHWCFSFTSIFTQTFIPHFPASGPPKNVSRTSSWLDNRWKFPLSNPLLIPLNFQTPAYDQAIQFLPFPVQHSILSQHNCASHLGKILVK